MYCIAHFDPMALQLQDLTVWPVDVHGNPYSWELNVNCGKGDQDLMPTIMDIIGTTCPFIDTSKFDHKYLSDFSVTNDCLTLSYCDNHNDFTDEPFVNLSVPIASLMAAFRVSKLTISICLYQIIGSHDKGDTELREIYDIAYNEDDDVAKVSFVAEGREFDAFLVEDNPYFEDSFDDSDEDSFADLDDDEDEDTDVNDDDDSDIDNTDTIDDFDGRGHA